MVVCKPSRRSLRTSVRSTRLSGRSSRSVWWTWQLPVDHIFASHKVLISTKRTHSLTRCQPCISMLGSKDLRLVSTISDQDLPVTPSSSLSMLICSWRLPTRAAPKSWNASTLTTQARAISARNAELLDKSHHHYSQPIWRSPLLFLRRAYSWKTRRMQRPITTRLMQPSNLLPRSRSRKMKIRVRLSSNASPADHDRNESTWETKISIEI